MASYLQPRRPHRPRSFLDHPKRESHTLTATWEQLESPLVGPPTVNPHIVFTVLIFAAAGQMQLDGMTVPGSSYPRDAWSKSLGQACSSCCFALAETMVAGHSSDEA